MLHVTFIFSTTFTTATDIIHGQLQRIENTLLLLVYGWFISFYFGLFVDV